MKKLKITDRDISGSVRGFTLIELLVVISIIGLLGSIVLAAVTDAKIKARDATKQAEVHQVSTAIQLMYQNNGKVPGNYYNSNGTLNGNGTGDGVATENDSPNLTVGSPAYNSNLAYQRSMQELVDTKVFPSIPKSPGGDTYHYFNYGGPSGTPDNAAFYTALEIPGSATQGGNSGSGGTTVVSTQPTPPAPLVHILSVTPSSVPQGGNMNISWSADNAPSGSAVVLLLYSNTGALLGRISQDLPAQGTYSWKVPGPACTTDTNGFKSCMRWSDSVSVNATNVGLYSIVAKLYTPAGGLGGGMLQPSPSLVYLATSLGASIGISPEPNLPASTLALLTQLQSVFVQNYDSNTGYSNMFPIPMFSWMNINSDCYTNYGSGSPAYSKNQAAATQILSICVQLFPPGQSYSRSFLAIQTKDPNIYSLTYYNNNDGLSYCLGSTGSSLGVSGSLNGLRSYDQPGCYFYGM